MNSFLIALFAILWSSASIATKFGLRAAAPLTLATFRFFAAGTILLGGIVLARHPIWPERQWWKPLAILGFLNTSLYLGASFVALKAVPAGLFNLFVATNPFLVALLSRWWLGRQLRVSWWLGLVVASLGLGVGSWGALTTSHAPIWAVLLVLLGMASMAVGSVYFETLQIPLPGIVVNTWQLILGAIFLLPAAVWMDRGRPILWTADWWGSLLWLVGAVSIGAMLLWFHLLRQGAARASLWLFLTPVIGYGLAALLLGEPITWADGLASLLVVGGLVLADRPRTTVSRLAYEEAGSISSCSGRGD
ncbi:MAG: DMT family transporter [Thermaerobacter sp.]|nr:DMT family transporter [Thermaerobacter sp.]